MSKLSYQILYNIKGISFVSSYLVRLIVLGRTGLQVLPEKEARVIAAQVLRGLAHLNHPEHKVIHYDLKPANCLFDAFGQVKITVSSCVD